MNWLEPPIFTALLGAAAAFLAIFISNWLTAARADRERLWELRRQAYGAILSELAMVERFCNVADDYIRENEDRYFGSKIQEVHDLEITKRMKNAGDRFSDDYLILSDEFISIFEKLANETTADDPNETPDEQHDSFTGAIRKYRPVLLKQARDEISSKNYRRNIP